MLLCFSIINISFLSFLLDCQLFIDISLAVNAFVDIAHYQAKIIIINITLLYSEIKTLISAGISPCQGT